MIQFKAIGSFTPNATGGLPVRLLPRRELSPMSRTIAGLRFSESGNHFIPVKKPPCLESSRHRRFLFRGMLPSFRRASTFRSSQVAIGDCDSILLRRDSSPCRIVFAAKCLALAFGFTASLGYAASYKTSPPVEFSTANDAVEYGTVFAIRPSTWPAVFAFPHIAPIEKPREFGGPLNVTNDTLSQTLSQYRANPISKETAGVTTNAWSLTRENGMVVKRHERGAQADLSASDEIVWTAGRPVEAWINSHAITHFDSDWDKLNISQSEVISSAEYQWRQIALNVVASGRELRINSGDSRIVNLAKSRMKNAIRTFNNNFSSDVYSSGSLTNQINGLQAIIADTNTNTVGGIDANTWEFWRNTVTDASALSVTPSATTIEHSLMLPTWMAVDRGPDDQPDLIVADSTYYQYYEESQASLKRYSSAQSASGGFVSLKYKNADVLYDGNSGIPTTHMYFINTEYFQLVVHKDADLEVMDDMRPIDQDGSVTPLLWMGNLVCSNRKMQAVIIP